MIDWQGRRVLVTGGAGFIGSHLVDRLVELGASVRVLDNCSTGTFDNLKGRTIALDGDLPGAIGFFHGDIRDLAACREACDGVDTVFHQAALANVPESLIQPSECIDVNVLGTANVFEAARDAKVRRVVYASSSAVYPPGLGREPPGLWESDAGWIVETPYALSKQSDERLAELFAYCYGMNFIGLRYFNVYGPRQRADAGAVVPCFLRAAAAGVQLVINGSGEQTRDFVHVFDVVEANMLAASAGAEACDTIYNVGTGRATSLNALARLISSRDIIYAAARPNETRCSVACLASIGNALGYSPKVALEDGIAQMLAVR